jgi:PadR family transcriptional regulator, regulatory protein AphA
MDAVATQRPDEGPLGSVAVVLLGFLRGWGPMSGYDIKTAVDQSARFFWNASYGQIYPELRRLTAAGLIEGESAPRGERSRTVYRITTAGRERLERWLVEPAERCEIRDEHLLKVFLSTADDAPGTRERLEHMAREHEARHSELVRLETMKPVIAEHPRLVLDYGLAFHAFAAAWCRERATALSEPKPVRRK